MKPLARSALLLAVLAAYLPADQIGDVRFRPPVGWKCRQTGPNERLYLATDVPPSEFASIVMVLGGDAQGRLTEQFRAAMQSTLAGKSIVRQTSADTSRTPQGYAVIGQQVTAHDGNREVLAQFAGVDAEGHFLFVGLLASSVSVQMAHQQAIAEFIGGIQFGPPAPGAASAATVPTHSTPRPGIVSGNIYDQHGQPLRIPGARYEIHIWGAGANGDRNGFTVPVGPDGHYESRVPHGLYGFHARAYLPLNGSTVCVDLAPMDGQPDHIAVDTTPGINKDFMLKRTGPIAGGNVGAIQGYYGGSITVTDGANWKEPYFGAMTRKYPAGSKVIVEMQPLSPAIDGSRVDTLRYECDLARMQSGDHKVGIPFAAYRATAYIQTPDGARRRLKIARLPQAVYGDSVDLLYPPDRDDHDGRPERPNILVM